MGEGRGGMITVLWERTRLYHVVVCTSLFCRVLVREMTTVLFSSCCVCLQIWISWTRMEGWKSRGGLVLHERRSRGSCWALPRWRSTNFSTPRGRQGRTRRAPRGCRRLRVPQWLPVGSFFQLPSCTQQVGGPFFCLQKRAPVLVSSS